MHLQYQTNQSYPVVYTLTSLPTEIGNITTLEKLYLNGNGLKTIPSSLTSLSNIVDLHLQDNFIVGYLDLQIADVINTLRLERNYFTGLKLNISPSTFPSTNPYYFSTKRNALGCIEVPTDELVSWQLSDFTETDLNIDK